MLRQALPFLSQPAGMVISARLRPCPGQERGYQAAEATRLDGLDSKAANRGGGLGRGGDVWLDNLIISCPSAEVLNL